MRRNVSLEEISDGRLYDTNDLVKADCQGCKGCARCCQGMGTSVVLDPYDIYRLQSGRQMGFAWLLQEGKLELNVVDGCILPNLRMEGEKEQCTFLDQSGRCSIHDSRPGICRLFPLGRYYENGDFRYILQTGQCTGRNPVKVKVGKWIDTPNQRQNHDFICAWHRLLKDVEKEAAGSGDGSRAKDLNMGLLHIFYLKEYNMEHDFYVQYNEREICFREQQKVDRKDVFG